MKTLGKFVLIDNERKKQTVLNWDTSQMVKTSGAFRLQDMNYSARKTIISDLHPHPLKSTSHFKPLYNRNLLTTTSTKQITPYIYSNIQRERPNTQTKRTSVGTTIYRTHSLRKVSLQKEPSLPRTNIEQTKVREKIIESDKKKGKILSVITMRRNGLRFKLQHSFFVVYKQTDHNQFLQEIKAQLFKQFQNLPQKRVYLFHLGKQPINCITKDLAEKQFVIFADVCPKFNLSFQFQMKLFQQASYLQQEIRKSKQNLQALKNQFMVSEKKVDLTMKGNGQHEWEKIGNVNEYVNKLVDNPQLALQIKSDEQEKDLMDEWCNQKAVKEREMGKDENEKNPFFDVNSHFPQEVSNHQSLIRVANKINKLPKTQNKHDIKVRAIQNMMEKVKKQNQYGDELKRKQEQRIKTIGFKSQKQIMRELDHKNVPLIRQNIPYIMEKYGINRAEAYNLFNLYKSLQKISAMRLFDGNQHRRVQEKGIDRKTFDEGLKGLQINPGEQLIRNICYFPEFISWEQFIKIVSISMRKTPMSKLEALLQGMGNSQDGFLSERQVDIMVGSSLYKIFGREQPELRQHFVGVVMKVMDKHQSGTIEIKQIKDYVLNRNMEDMDLVTYLMLNS